MHSLTVARDRPRGAAAAAGPERACRFCGSALSTCFLDLGTTPLAQSFLKAAELDRMEPHYPLDVRVCEACWLVQLAPYVRAEEIFSDYAYFSSYSDTWLAHARRYTDEIILRLGLDRRSRIVEVASNDGYLLRNFLERGFRVLGIEPAANVAAAARARGVPTLVRFFGKELAEELCGQGQQADLLVANNVLAHVPDLNGFVEGIRILLAPGGVATLEFPHLARLIWGVEFDTIYHEHYSYFSFTTVETVFATHGLVVFDVEELPTHGGSLRIYVRRLEDASKPAGARVEALRRAESAVGMRRLDYYLAFAEKVREAKRGLLEFLIGAKRRGASIAGYGAPAKGNTLLNFCGIGRDFIDFTVDRSPHKQGLYCPGSRIPILAPEEIGRRRPDYLIILPWNLAAEVMEQNASIRDWGGTFVVPIPEVKVFGGSECTPGRRA